MAIALERLCRFKDAVNHAERAVDIASQIFGPNHCEVKENQEFDGDTSFVYTNHLTPTLSDNFIENIADFKAFDEFIMVSDRREPFHDCFKSMQTEDIFVGQSTKCVLTDARTCFNLLQTESIDSQYHIQEHIVAVAVGTGLTYTRNKAQIFSIVKYSSLSFSHDTELVKHHAKSVSANTTTLANTICTDERLKIWLCSTYDKPCDGLVPMDLGCKFILFTRRFIVDHCLQQVHTAQNQMSMCHSVVRFVSG
ncbi:unnamed protein product [Rotaria sp. Silwood2]|nr:unnamed protein product [Rotaria sp. Silwood2]